VGQLDHILKGLCSALSVDTGPSDIVTIDVRAVRGSSGSSPGLKNMAHNKVFDNKKHEMDECDVCGHTEFEHVKHGGKCLKDDGCVGFQ